MKLEVVLDWIGYFIKQAAEDPTSARRIARISALRNVEKIVQNEFAPRENITIRKINAVESLSSYMKGRLLHIIKEGSEPPSLAIVDELANIHGLGRAKAEALVKLGVKSVKDLTRKNSAFYEDLPIETKIWLKYKPLNRIPRAYIEQVEKALLPLLKKYKWVIAGSYRRGKPYSSDIDLIVAPKRSNSRPVELDNILQCLSSMGPIPYASGPDKVSTLINWQGVYLKMDIMKTVSSEYPYFLLYLTGSKEHNIAMRKAAKAHGMLLNQRGLFRGITTIPAKNEQQIFRLLDMPYKAPENR